MSGSEITTIVLLVLISLLACVAGVIVLVLFARRPKPRLATPTPIPWKRPARRREVAYRSLTPSSLLREPAYRQTGRAGQGARMRAATLLIHSGPLRDAQVPLTRPMIALGRSCRCDITLPDPQVSRQHSRLEWQKDGLYLVDTNSTNGTYVNGRRIRQICLRGGELVRIGHTVLTIQLY